MLYSPTAEAATVVFFDTYASLDANGQFVDTTNRQFFLSNGGTFVISGSIGEARADLQGRPYNFTQVSTSLFAASNETDDAASAFRTSFAVDAPFLIDFDFFVSADGTGFARGSLVNQTTQTIITEAAARDGFQQLDFSGVLEPGVYSLSLFGEVTAQPRLQSNGRFGGDFELREITPVPEPATLTLFGVGLAAAAWHRRRH
jgi:hypothetical protein